MSATTTSTLTLTLYGAHGSLVCRDEAGRFCSPPPGWREMWTEARRRQQVAERRSRLAADAAIHRVLGQNHQEPFPSLNTPGERAWTRRNVNPWMEV